MLPVLEGIIARRVLVNYRADPAIVQKLLPPPLEVEQRNGRAIVGICLIRLESLRPRGIPRAMGTSSENMAHRVAIRYPTRTGLQPGVFIWRRDTDQCLMELLGGRAFPGVHVRADFHIEQDDQRLRMRVITKDAGADVALQVGYSKDWKSTASFPTFAEASAFFEKGDCGFSCSLHGNKLEGMQLRTLQWSIQPLAVEFVKSAFYSNEARFPSGSIDFDCGLIMRGVPHQWHELSEVPEFATA
ncbi:MAG: DUF2071 domain-containing protein [Acidobacteriaceae bacterium]|nr:DUF2071 domain-containing protein [Acidobacteriaceae bacterium]